ncbi:HET-domain-containing protein [Didymella exigua CBS 183.55]|uniref:HET-domain-containing protein n=1 Tax=Didymella exigua CBS 183.55 TaxID=1150837 RepID=A0A6A5RVH5_9PLEO|nr:HET-domain-containing protein [Didymella exigua CBS 183.55]KAF1932475.1 HET-domain-containing protein [Didymella exigua CBS 183.55]
MEADALLEYRVLDPPGNAIRILLLLPGGYTDDVQLVITHEKLQEEKRIPYECLSYTWGSEPPTEKLYVWQESSAHDGGHEPRYLFVRNNLLTALRYLRLAHSPRRIWVDAICINQDNLQEKGREVARMGLIYRMAAHVLVWIGPEDETTSTAVETIERLSPGVILSSDHRNCDTIPGSEAAVVRYHLATSTLTSRHWLALSSLIQRPWFRRLWIRQEVLLASKVLLRCGNTEIDWAKLEKVIIFVEHKVSREHISASDILYCRSLFPYVGSDSLVYTLHRSSLCGHTDPRDLIYANLSTSTAMKQLQIEPDYDASIAHVYKDMVCKYMQRFKSLELLRSCDLPSLEEGFKSFVPYFGKPKSESRLFAVFAHAGSRQSFSIADNENIVVKGRIVTTVQTVSGSRKPFPRHTHDGDNFMEIIETYRHWEPNDLMTSAAYPSGGSLLDAFVLLLSNGFCKETYHMDHLPSLHQSRESFLAAVWSGGDRELSKDFRYKAYIDELMSDRRSEVFFRTTEGYIGVSPTNVESGDHIATLPGLSVAIALRPVGDASNTFHIVGPCFLQGVMFGEGLLGPLPEGWSCEMHSSREWCFRKDDKTATWEDPRLWPLPSSWASHLCDMSVDHSPCDENCKMEKDGAGELTERWFYNVETKEKTREDPRLDVQGLEAGGVALQSFTIM